MTFLKLFGLIIIFLAPSVIVTTSAEFVSTSHLLSEEASYTSEIQKWRAERLEEINGENGWTTLVGLFWLNEGQNRFGSDLSNDIVLPRNRSPKLAGSLHLSKEVVRLEVKPVAGITNNGTPAGNMALQTDAEGKPTVLKMGSLTFFVIKRGEKFGLRVKDKQHPARTRFAGLGYFPIDPNWRLKAKFEPYNPPKIVPIVNVLGMVENMISPGALAFEMNGKTYRLDPVLEKGSKQLFIIFADQTSGKESYGAGRYLYSEPPDSNGEVVVDFNKAHNPPCAFTRFATCPLPPRQNRLGLRVDAGEMKYRATGH
jgi:uncharacterized protein